MSALVDGLRSWWRHRNDPPPMLPDKVRWTRPIAPHEPVGKTIEQEEARGWQMVPGSLVLRRKGPGSVQFVRFDGAYRWRDDSMKGF